MRHLIAALAVTVLTTGLAEARPPDHLRPADSMRWGDSHRASMPTPKMDSAVMARVREKLSRADQIGRPTDFARMNRPAMATGLERRAATPAPNPFAKLEKAAAAKAIRNLSAKARFEGSPKGIRTGSSRAATGGGSAVAAPNPFAKLEKAAVMKAQRNLSAKAHFAGSAKGIRGISSGKSAGAASAAVRAPNPFAKLEKAAVAKAMRSLSAKAHFAGSAKGIRSGATRSSGSTAATMTGPARFDSLGAAAQSRIAREADVR